MQAKGVQLNDSSLNALGNDIDNGFNEDSFPMGTATSADTGSPFGPAFAIGPSPSRDGDILTAESASPCQTSQPEKS